jgi:hypothetical protein
VDASRTHANDGIVSTVPMLWSAGEGQTYNDADFGTSVRNFINTTRQHILAQVAGTGGFTNEGLFDKMVKLEKMYYGNNSFFRRYSHFDTAQKVRALGANAVDTIYSPSHRLQSDMQDAYQRDQENEVGELDQYELLLNGRPRTAKQLKKLDVFKNAREHSKSPIRSGITARRRSSATASSSSAGEGIAPAASSSSSSSSSEDEGDDNPPQGSRGRSGSMRSHSSHRSGSGSPYFPLVQSPGGSVGGMSPMSPSRWL